MPGYLDIENWERKDHFHFFKAFDEPFFGVTVDVDCTKAYDHCKSQDISFFLFYLHRSLRAANRIEPFKYRIIEDRVRIADRVDASPTINRPNGSFGFSYMKFHDDLADFISHAKIVIEQVQNSSGLFPPESGENVIHYSSLPWITFTALSHARNYAIPDSSPKISFGKMTERDGKRVMPVSIHVHHALVDGQDVANYIDLFQEIMNTTK